MKRGSLYWVNLEPSAPPEFGKVRPCLILSNSEQNSKLSSIVVVPLSSKAPEIWPLRVEINLLKKKSFAVIPGLRQVSKTRFTELIGVLPSHEMNRIDEAIALYLND